MDNVEGLFFPCIILPVTIGQHMIGVDSDGDKGLGRGEMKGSGGGLQPGLHWKGYPLFRAVLPGELEDCRKGEPVEVGDGNIDDGAGRGGGSWGARGGRPGAGGGGRRGGGMHALDGDIETPVVEEPAAPEPGEVFAGLIIHHVEEVVGTGMAISPSLDIPAEGIVEAVGAEDLFPQ